MRHPFELELSELETINLKIQELNDQEAEKVSGGGCDITTMATKEEGGDDPTTMAFGEEGGGVTTLALGGEKGGDFPFPDIPIEQLLTSQ